ncbi:11151_t:CDS:2 [Ambispora gerdemannii]|uniref:Holocytochrome c-type synthase n=1 Tax=Ambispora gerdemannii TaxID=144530 RepID=A0A9N8VAW2_9GLOM|nr:11151_t:CDS:2 [Ambispora gerdemannii]
MATKPIPSECPMRKHTSTSKVSIEQPEHYGIDDNNTDDNNKSYQNSCPRHSGDALSPDNQIPKLTQEPAPGQTIPLPTSRVISSIPKAKSKEYWEYPSPQQFYNALVRKGWETPEESIETMVDIHNFLNEEAWNEILKWEGMRKRDCDRPKLLRFRGRPHELSPKARIIQWAGKIFPSLGTPPPFDRHDWTIDRCGKEVRYVIDYYAGPDEGDTPVFYLDVRPALDSVDSVVDRIRLATKETFEQLRARAQTGKTEER